MPSALISVCHKSCRTDLLYWKEILLLAELVEVIQLPPQDI